MLHGRTQDGWVGVQGRVHGQVGVHGRVVYRTCPAVPVPGLLYLSCP